MEYILQIILDLVVEFSIVGVSGDKLSEKIRIFLSVVASLVDVMFIAFSVWLFWSNSAIWVKVVSAGMVVFFIGDLISMWRKVLKEKRERG